MGLHNVRFSQRVIKKKNGVARFYYGRGGTLVIPRFKRLVMWKHTIDFLIDNVSHETLHVVLKKRLGEKASLMLDRLRVNMWEDVPDRAGLNFKPYILRRLDYDNRYVPLADR